MCFCCRYCKITNSLAFKSLKSYFCILKQDFVNFDDCCDLFCDIDFVDSSELFCGIYSDDE